MADWLWSVIGVHSWYEWIFGLGWWALFLLAFPFGSGIENVVVVVGIRLVQHVIMHIVVLDLILMEVVVLQFVILGDVSTVCQSKGSGCRIGSGQGYVLRGVHNWGRCVSRQCETDCEVHISWG